MIPGEKGVVSFLAMGSMIGSEKAIHFSDQMLLGFRAKKAMDGRLNLK